MVAYIRKMAVERKQWLDEETFRDGVALCQTLPGATAMQAAAYVGLRARGTIGAGTSFIGFGLPAFLLMIALSALYASTHTLPAVVSAFGGLQAIIVAIVANATGILCSFVGLLLTVTVRFAENVPWDAFRLILAGAAFLALLWKVDILWVVVIGTILSVLVLR